MKKTKLTRSLLAACSIVALSAVMYGCTGDGSENDLKATQGDLESVQAELDAANARIAELEGQVSGLEGDLMTAQNNAAGLQMDLDAANATVAGLQTQLDTANMNAADLQMDLDAANANVADLQMQLAQAGDNAADLQMQLDAATMNAADLQTQLDAATMNAADLQTQLDTATMNAADLQTQLDAANADVADLQTRLMQAEADRDMYQQMVRDAEQEEIDEERIARAKAIATAMSSNRVGAEQKMRVGSAFTDSGGTVTPGTQLPFPIDDEATNANNNNHGVTATRMSDGAVEVELGGTPAGATDPLTDLEFTGGGAMADADNPWTSAMLSRELGEDTVRTTDDATEEVVVYTDIEAPTPTALATEFASGETYVEIDSDPKRGRVAPDSAPSAGGPSFQYDEGHEFGGTYRGIPGTFECLAGGCDVMTDADGEVSVTGNSQFTPDSITATFGTPDSDYVYFGWWLHKPDNNAAVHMVEAFAGGTNPAEAPAALEGTATYEGPAAGKYVTKTFTAGDLADAQVGHFTATAELTANFGPDPAGDLPADMISGTITEFEQDGESLGNWEVTLGDASIAVVGTFNGATSVNFGGATTTAAGSWEGRFYAPGDTPASDHPGAAAGTFDAHLMDGTAHISGAFGAHKED